MKQTEKASIEECGCEFTTLWNNETSESCCFLSKCRCKKHYNEQFVAEINGIREGFEPENPLPLQEVTK